MRDKHAVRCGLAQFFAQKVAQEKKGGLALTGVTWCDRVGLTRTSRIKPVRPPNKSLPSPQVPLNASAIIHHAIDSTTTGKIRVFFK